MADSSRFYWSIEVPGMDEGQAEWLVEVAKSSGLTLAHAVNPEHFLSLHLDRDTVEGIRAALVSRQEGGVKSGLLEALEEWLEYEAQG